MITRHLSSKFEKRYNPTLGIDICPPKFSTNKGDIVLDCWDRKNLPVFGMGFTYKLKQLFLSLMSAVGPAIKNIPTWYRDVTRICGTIPIVLCGNRGRFEGQRSEIKDSSFSPKVCNTVLRHGVRMQL